MKIGLRYILLLLLTVSTVILQTAAGHTAANWSVPPSSIPALVAQSAAVPVISQSPIDENLLRTAQSLNAEGSLQFNQGNVEAALIAWREAEQYYRKLNDTSGIAIVQINQVQALRSLGYYTQGQQVIVELRRELVNQPDSLLKAQGLQAVGVALRGIGEFEASTAVLLESLAIARQEESSSTTAQILFQLGNTAQADSNDDDALTFYQQARTAADPNSRIWLETALNQCRLLVEQGQSEAAAPLISEVRSRLETLSPSRWAVYAQVNFAETLAGLPQYANKLDGADILVNAIDQARTLNDLQAESYALGQLGKLYETAQQWVDALTLTEQAIQKAQQVQATDMIASWQWQKGRILKAQGDRDRAVEAYSEAVVLLESIDRDLVALNSDAQFSFQQQVEPVYRQLVTLLLEDIDSLAVEKKQQRLVRSREVIESLQIATLENFFRQACLTYAPRAIDEIDSQAAVLYPIILGDRLEVILSLPNQPLQHYGTTLQESQGLSTFQLLRQSLNPAFLSTEILPPAQQLYDWIVRPAEAALAENSIQRLVFVLDGYLRSVPMAVLHDGSQFLIERYGIALTPGLQLFDSSKFARQRLDVLAGGITSARQGFSELPAVATELNQLKSLLPTQILLNEAFTERAFAEKMTRFSGSVVHLATHGQFSSKSEETFILTWDERLQLSELQQLLQQRELRKPLDLLVLSACQTAKGDEKAALGMAGVAIRSGAKSTIASLWSVQDRSTAVLMTQLYQRLKQSPLSLSEALQQAQLSLLNSEDYSHPYYWAPFVLIGSWL